MSQTIGELRLNRFKKIAGGLQAVPNVATDLIAKRTWLKQFYVTNPTTGSINLTVQDKQTTPRNIIPTVAITAGSSVLFSWPEPIECIGGINWLASAVGLEAEVQAFYVP